jgi:sec-independent protein translocase protein TatA
MDIGWPEILIVLVIVLLLFGPGRISKVAGEIGSGIRNFRKSLDGQDEKKEDSKKEGDESKDSKDQGSS